MKDWATALCRSDEAGFDRFLASSAPACSALLRPSHASALPGPSRQDRAGSERADAICPPDSPDPETTGPIRNIPVEKATRQYVKKV